LSLLGLGGVFIEESAFGLEVGELSPVCDLRGFHSLLREGSYYDVDLNFFVDAGGHLVVSSDSGDGEGFRLSGESVLLYEYGGKPLPVFRVADRLLLGDSESVDGVSLVRPSGVEIRVFRGRVGWE
jgi:hypothetical protein